MDRPQLDIEIREPTGLRLGLYDLHQLRGMAYLGQVRPDTEYLDGDAWSPLADHPAIGPVFWLTGADKRQPGVVGQARFGGWKLEGARDRRAAQVSLPPTKTGLLGRIFGRK